MMMMMIMMMMMMMLQKQIEALKQLCLKAGIRDADIAACSATREFIIIIIYLFSKMEKCWMKRKY